jgi:parvulin-like peptidyl-prolyl isomerase
VKERAKSVSFARVKEYYTANKDKYKEVQTIDCRHIQLKDYDLAINLRDKIDQGADMVALVKKYSLAPDKNNPEPGLISGIKNDAELHKRPRIETLCMMPKQGESEVVRDGDFFHVVKAERRTDGYPPLDETTHLREDIAREIAAQELRTEFDAHKQKVLRSVDIRINKIELEKLN